MGRDPFKQSRKLQAITKEREPKPLKGVLQVFLPLSILCFLLSNYSSCLLNINLSSTTTLLNNINHFIDRKAIFLFSNAILLFLVKESGLLCHCSSPVDRRLYDEFTARKGDHSRLKTDAVEEKAIDSPVQSQVVEKATVESGKALELVVIEAGDEEGIELVGINEMKDVGVDELNRRSEEFIESVKRGWRMEALHVVTV